MLPLETSMTLATIIGLICNWKQERGAEAQDRFQDFITWLTQHHYNELAALINSSIELQSGLNEFLRQDISKLSSELESVSSAIAAVSSKLDKLSILAIALSSKGDALSEQALSILRKFEELEATSLLVEGNDPEAHAHLYFLNESKEFRVKEPRFLNDDISFLLHLGFIQKDTSYDRNGNFYSATRAGILFIRNARTCSDYLTESEPVEMFSGGGSY